MLTLCGIVRFTRVLHLWHCPPSVFLQHYRLASHSNERKTWHSTTEQKHGPASVKSRFDRRFPKTKGKKITQAIRSAHMSSRNPKRKRNADLIETKQTQICKLEREEMKRNRTKHSRAEAKNQCIRKSKCIPSLQAAEARSTKRDAALRK
jgi:hypothetical protein